MNQCDAPIYICADFLDCVTDGRWHAVVAEQNGAYTGLIPYAMRHKLSIKYLHQPFLVQQMGYYGQSDYIEKTWQIFYEKVLRTCFHVDYTLKAADLNYARILLNRLSFEERINQTIDLNKPYHQIYDQYRRDRKRDIKKLEDSHLIIEHDADAAFMALKETGYLNEKFLSVEYREALKKLLNCYISNKQENFFYLINGATQTRIACGFFPSFGERVYNFIIAKYMGEMQRYAFSALLDKIILKYAESKVLFDLEGSNLPGVQDFFTSLGGKKQSYYYFKRRIWK